MKKIKIVNIVSRLVFGGVESVIYNYYSNMDRSNLEVTLITKNNSNSDAIKKFEDLGFKIILVGDWEKKPIAVGKEIISILKENKFDIIHCHLSHTNFYFLFLAWKNNIPVRISHSHLSQNDKNIIQKFKHFLYKILIRMFSTVKIACGEEAGICLYGKKSNYFILRNSIDLEKYSYNENVRKEYREQFKIDNETICIGNIGRLTKQKNQKFLVEIFNEFSKLEKKSKLIIVGSGENKSDLIKIINELKIENKVIFLENRTDVNNILQMFDIFCLPSLYEGLPVVGIEAQASDLDCVFTDTIDFRVKVTDKVKFLSLNDDASVWAKKMYDIIQTHHNRNNNITILSNAGYNIKIEANKLLNLYLEKYKEVTK